MNSKSKSKLDLLVRVRYSNPLPPPPFPPKLLSIPTHPSRYAAFEFAQQLADETPFPMVVDADMGMPIDLSQYVGLWDYDVGETEPDYELNPDPNNIPELDPKDAYLVSDMPSSFANGHASTSSAVAPSLNVSWLRKTEYLTSSSAPQASTTRDIRPVDEPMPDVSHEAQILDIESSFGYSFAPDDLNKLRHPSKPHLRAIESYEVLPDTRIWPNAYDLVRFSERPGERPPEQFDSRLETAIIRPIIGEDGESFLSYYLTKEDAESVAYNTLRQTSYESALRKAVGNSLLDGIHHDEETDMGQDKTSFQFLRDYETVKIDMDVPNEFLLAFDNGESEILTSVRNANITNGSKGAYYKNIERKYVLKKKRQNKHDDYSNRWDVIHIVHKPFSEEELQERTDTLAEVNDPDFLANAAAAEMKMEAEGDDDGQKGFIFAGDDSLDHKLRNDLTIE